MPIPSSSSDIFTTTDLAEIARRGLSFRDALDQVGRLAAPPVGVILTRTCTVGGGIVQLGEAAQARAVLAHAAAATAGRVSHFLPASGAATRMFQDLASSLADDGISEVGTSASTAFFANLHRFPFEPALRQTLAARGASLDEMLSRGAPREILDALLSSEGLNFASMPKGLIPFHRSGGKSRTAFEDHLAEAAVVAADDSGRFRLHATVSPGHQPLFESHLAQVIARGSLPTGVTPEVVFSMQDPATDTLALDDSGHPVRDADGSLLFRPAGHGALFNNLASHAASSCPAGGVIFIKNIDNVAPPSRKAPTLHWCRVLLGLASQLREESSALLNDLEGGRAVDAAQDFVSERLGRSFGATMTRTELMELLDRPIRVCGMVRNEGEPGGGPFWVADRTGVETCQIIESAQVSADLPGKPGMQTQAEIFRSGTHFNPVFMACAPTGRLGRLHDLTRFVDPDAVIIARKSHGGRTITVLERPGLWNGAMAGWLTLFVEVPIEVFNPVKTVNDLLRPVHQAG